MIDLSRHVSSLRRPRLLLDAARHGMAGYDRPRHLGRLTGHAPAARALDTLIAEEDRMDRARRNGLAGYSLSRHVELLIALLAEARLATDLS